MRRNSVTRLLALVLPVAMSAALGGCAFRSPMPLETEGQVEPAEWAGKEDLESLKTRVADLERRLDETTALAERADMTAEKALKCCRKEYTVIMTEEIYFDFNKFDIKPESHAALDRVAEKLKSDPDLIVELKGYTDGIGSSDYNIVLGQKRADAARTYLVSRHSIAMGRLAIQTFGEDAPIASNDTEEGRAKNRRVTIDVLGFAP